MRATVLFLLLNVLLPCAAFAQDAPAKPLSAREAYVLAMRELKQEASDAKESLKLPRLRADYAAQFGHEIDRELVASKLLRPMDRDAFVDAYMRWQMTGFLDGLPAMEDAEFEQFLDHLPACVQNPQMSDAFVQPLMRASRETELQPSDQKVVRTMIDAMQAQRDQAGVMRRPAEELRNWIAEHVGEDGNRPVLAAFENCVALARAGWDLRRAKGAIDEQCERALRDRSFKEDQRERIAKQMEVMKPISVLRITNAAMSEEGVLSVSSDEEGIHDYELRKWARTIRRQ